MPSALAESVLEMPRVKEAQVRELLGGCGRILEPRRWSSRKKRRGAAVVEFALVAPLFILLVFGMIEFGRMVMVQQVLVNATREGARQAVLDGSTRTEVDQIINQYLTASGINTPQIEVDPPNPASAGFGQPVRVTITVPFSDVSWMPVPMYLGATTLTASSVMRRETAQ